MYYYQIRTSINGWIRNTQKRLHWRECSTTAPEIYIDKIPMKGFQGKNYTKNLNRKFKRTKKEGKKKKKKSQLVSYNSQLSLQWPSSRSAFAEERTECIYTNLSWQHDILLCQTIFFWRSVPCSVNNGPE